MELNIEVDKKNNRIGLRPLSDFQTGKFIHRSAHLLLINSEGKMLIHKRSANKKWYPSMYSYSVSGTVADESYEHCIKRETKEELGLSLRVKLLFVYKYFDKADKSFHALFISSSDKKVYPDKREMSKIKWMSERELSRDLTENPRKYVPHVRLGMKKYFALLKLKKKKP